MRRGGRREVRRVWRRGEGFEVPERGSMRVVAGDAMVPLTRAAREIPIAAHSAVRSVSIVAGLRPVTLRAELHRVAQRDVLAVR